MEASRKGSGNDAHEALGTLAPVALDKIFLSNQGMRGDFRGEGNVKVRESKRADDGLGSYNKRSKVCRVSHK